MAVEMVSPIELSAGAATVVVAPNEGGRIAQITVAGRPLLRGPEHGSTWADWGSYPLIPWTNRIPGGLASLGGVDLALPVNWPDGTAIHGLGADRPWEVTDAGPAHVELSLAVAVDRYDIVGTQRFELTAERLVQELSVVNRADVAVPAGLGIHPWFSVAPVTAPATMVWSTSGPLDPMPNGGPRPVAGDDDLRAGRTAAPMDLCFTGLTDDVAAIGDLRLSWRGPIDQLVVYSGESGWVCVEPCTMANDGIRLAADGRTDTGVVMLEPGATLAVGYTFSWSQ
jgi:aldose 1-epimerase